MEVFTVIAHRWGDDHNHSYFVGTYSDEALADEMALAEEYWRGGKYKCKISSYILNEIDKEVLDNYRTEVKQ
jgi:phosphoribosylaminoimidazole-succinocarboxamide synthase